MISAITCSAASARERRAGRERTQLAVDAHEQRRAAVHVQIARPVAYRQRERLAEIARLFGDHGRGAHLDRAQHRRTVAALGGCCCGLRRRLSGGLGLRFGLESRLGRCAGRVERLDQGARGGCPGRDRHGLRRRRGLRHRSWRSRLRRSVALRDREALHARARLAARRSARGLGLCDLLRHRHRRSGPCRTLARLGVRRLCDFRELDDLGPAARRGRGAATARCGRAGFATAGADSARGSTRATRSSATRTPATEPRCAARCFS